MPFYDLTCPNDHKQRDVFLKLGERPPCSTCGEPTETLWEKSSGVIGDECYVWAKNGICHENGDPKLYTSKAAMKKAADEKGLVNRVRHLGTKGGDRSPHTTRWY
jgi:hypothetical protein